MSDESVAAALNALLAAEQRAIAPRLFESTVFVSNASVTVAQLARRLASVSRSNQQALADQVISLGGVPALRRGDARSADLHYQELRAIVPRLVADYGRLVEQYRTAGPRVASDPASSALVARLLAVLDQELQALKDLGGASHMRVAK